MKLEQAVKSKLATNTWLKYKQACSLCFTYKVNPYLALNKTQHDISLCHILGGIGDFSKGLWIADAFSISHAFSCTSRTVYFLLHAGVRYTSNFGMQKFVHNTSTATSFQQIIMILIKLSMHIVGVAHEPLDLIPQGERLHVRCVALLKTWCVADTSRNLLA